MTASDPLSERDSLHDRDPDTIPAVAVIAPTIGLSAFLLFSVEPLIGRLMLPSFGGGPGVWASVLAFFQGVLLLGYLYGHVLVTRIGIRRGAIVHLVIVAAAAGALLVAPSRPADVAQLRNEALLPVLDLLAILTVTIGPAAFALAATTPLLLAWYNAAHRGAGTDAESRPDPYWLYALSNAASLAALLAYPFLIEPSLGLSSQRRLWGIGFVGLWLLLGASALVVLRRLTSRPALEPAAAEKPAACPIDARRRVRWILLAAIPAGLLAAVTNVIATDLVSAPLLWVGPLAIYLLTFVVAFSERGRRAVPRARWLAPVAVTLLWVPFGSAAGWPIVPLLLLEYGGFAVVALALHGRVALDRPPATQLTEFFLLLSLGGVIGGSFVAILAPIAFKGIWEYPILLVGALAVLAWEAGAAATSEGRLEPPAKPVRGRGLQFRPFVSGAPGRLLPYLAVAVPLAVALGATGSIGFEAGLRWLLVGGLILLLGGQPRFLALATALVLSLSTFVIPRSSVFQDRSFFGVSEVLRPAGGPVTMLMNGTTLHGVQSTDPAQRRTPLSYYTRSGPVGDLFATLRGPGPNGAAAACTGPSIGIVGLGAGGLAAYAGDADRITFYEIDPVVVRVASDPAYFTYLADTPVKPAVVLGDARLSLRDVPDETHDVVILDAFSSDTIPVHLMTVEAFREYARVLRPGGTLVVHVSNRFYDLASPAAAAAEAAGLTALARFYAPSEADRVAGASPSIWVAASTCPEVLAALERRGWQPAGAGVRPLTDDFADILRFLRPGNS